MNKIDAIYTSIDTDQIIPFTRKRGSRGPSPKPPRLETRPRIPTGKTRRPNRTYYWYIVDGSHEESTFCPYDKRGAAEEKLRLYNLRKTVPQLKQADLASCITFDAVIVSRLKIMGDLAHTPDEHRNMDRLRYACVHLLRAFSGMKMAAYKDAYSEKYVVWYTEQRKRAKAGEDISDLPGPFFAEESNMFPQPKAASPEPESYGVNDAAKKEQSAAKEEQQKQISSILEKGEPDPRTSAIGHLRLFKRMTRDFAQKEGIGYDPKILVPTHRRRNKGRHYFTRDELARLLWACRGRRWDPNKIRTEIVKGEVILHAGGWQTQTILDKDGVARETRVILRRDHVVARKGMARAIEIGFRTGSREEVIASYTWPAKGRGRRTDIATFDVDDEGQGSNHRRGSREEDTNKSRPTSKVNADLAFWLKIWKRADGQSNRTTERELTTGASPRLRRKYVVRQRDGSHYDSDLPFKAIARDAGLPWAGIHMLKKTANEISLVMKVGLSAASAALGTQKKTLGLYYTDEENVDLETAKRAYDEPAARQRFRLWREASNEADDKQRAYDSPYTKGKAA